MQPAVVDEARQRIGRRQLAQLRLAPACARPTTAASTTPIIAITLV